MNKHWMFPWEREAFPHRTGKDGGMTDLRDGGWATLSEELTALTLEARRRGMSYGQLAANTDRWDLCEIIRDYCAEKKRRGRKEHADTRGR